MIVAADPAHDPKERLWRNENTEAIAEDDERRGNVECPCQQEHGKDHRDASNNAGETTAKHRFGSAHVVIVAQASRLLTQRASCPLMSTLPTTSSDGSSGSSLWMIAAPRQLELRSRANGPRGHR